MKVIIDRFEGNFAVCETEDKMMINIERSIIPADARESDVINIEGDTVTIDNDETKKKKDEIDGMADQLWR